MQRLYTVKEEYVNYLRKFDERVPKNKDEKRPYVGIVLKVKNNSFFVPLSSPKEKHKYMKDGITVSKIDGGKFGVMNFNNMIPINKKDLMILVGKNEKRKELIKNQLRWFNKNKRETINKADKLYNLHRIKKLNPKVYSLCNNFKLLEEKCLEWEKLKEVKIEKKIIVEKVSPWRKKLKKDKENTKGREL